MTGNPPSPDQALIRTALDQARQTALQIDGLRAANTRTIRTLEAAFNQALNVPINAPSTVPLAHADHRRSHRAGVPPRIASDPELEAFIRARIDRLTFTQIIAEIAAAFPPERRTSLPALSRWWKLNRQISSDPT
ncbi:MAG TPA: hypothetical protein PKA03_00500 [Tabrizicola sp.]|nr:hypothetical protein [Tabrizicola sp.]